jgi:hypothetical protein
VHMYAPSANINNHFACNIQKLFQNCRISFISHLFYSGGSGLSRDILHHSRPFDQSLLAFVTGEAACSAPLRKISILTDNSTASPPLSPPVPERSP